MGGEPWLCRLVDVVGDRIIAEEREAGRGISSSGRAGSSARRRGRASAAPPP
jgi:hypothetical protein